jgi:hypothetical protein
MSLKLSPNALIFDPGFGDTHIFYFVLFYFLLLWDKIKIRGCPKVTGMRYHPEEQENVSALVQIFNAIPSSSFSAPAELCLLIPSACPFPMLIRISNLLLHRAQYILGVRQGRIPSQDGSGRLTLQCRFDISLLLYYYFISCLFKAEPKI